MKPEGVERIEIEVLSDKKKVAWGADTTVVRDIVFVAGIKAEGTSDWYAQHTDGSVWYMGEDTATYENGQLKATKGAWEAGVDGALPGIAMPGTPTVGRKYKQEYYKGKAEDLGEIVAAEKSVTVRGGSFSHCIQTHDTSAIDSMLDELKTYCPGVGLVLVEEDGIRVELIEKSVP